MSDVDELRAQVERDETLCRLIEKHLGGNYARTLGIEMPPKSDMFDERACAEYRAEFAARRLAWLESRLDEVNHREAWRVEHSRARSLGVSRFIPDGMTLDDLIATTVDHGPAMDELREERFANRQDAREHALEAAQRD